MPGIVRAGGVVDIALSPPLGFIEAQSGAFRDRLADLSGLWERFKRTMTEIEVERFATQGFGEWPALAESTVEQKARDGFPFGPLIRTGELVDSLTDAERAAQMTPWRLTWGTDVAYAKYHQGFRDDAGAPADPGRPPVRKVLDVRVEDRRRLETDMVGWLNDVARETFGAAE